MSIKVKKKSGARKVAPAVDGSKQKTGEGERMRQMNVALPESLIKTLRRIALDEDLTLRELVEKILSDYVTR